MYKTIRKGILGRIGIGMLVAVMLVGLMPLAASATDVSKNTIAVTPVVSGETSVGTTVEFAKAAGDSKVTKINLTNNLVFADFQQFARKTTGELVIDGGGIYSIRVAKSDWWQCCLDPTNHASIEFKEGYSTVTFQNVNLSGEAFNGFVYSKESTSFVFDNVNFNGPALAITKNNLQKYSSTVTIKDSNINLKKRVPDSKDSAKTSYIYPSEAVEIGFGDIILAGTVNITKEDPKNNDLDHDEIFYFKEKAGNLIVEPGAVVDINNYSKVNGSLYWSGLVFIGCCLADINFTVGEGAKFSYYGEGGTIIENYGLRNFTVGEKAAVDMKVFVPQTAKVKSVNLIEDTGSYFKAENINIKANAKVNVILDNKSLFAREAVVGASHLTVNENAAFRVLSPSNTVGETALRMHGKAPSICLDRPDEVLLYNGNKPCSAKSATNALEAAGVCDGLLDDAKVDIALTFIGAGIRTWCAKDNSIGLSYDSAKAEWTVDPTKATTWSTNIRAKQFTLKGCIAKKDGSFLKTTLSDPNNYLTLDVKPANNPASATDGIKCFSNKSVIQFNGAAAPKVSKALIYERGIYESFEFGLASTNTIQIIELEGDGVAPIVYPFETNQYESIRMVFNESDGNYNPRYSVPESPGTVENLDPNVHLDIDGIYATLTIYPVDGEYPEVSLYYALHNGFGPGVYDYLMGTYGSVHPDFDPSGPDYWYYAEV